MAALAFGRESAGAAIDGAMAEAGIEGLIEKAVAVLKAVGGGKLPKLLLPQVVVWGRVPGAKELFKVLEDQLKIAPQAPVEQGVRWGADQASSFPAMADGVRVSKSNGKPPMGNNT